MLPKYAKRNRKMFPKYAKTAECCLKNMQITQKVIPKSCKGQEERECGGKNVLRKDETGCLGLRL